MHFQECILAEMHSLEYIPKIEDRNAALIGVEFISKICNLFKSILMNFVTYSLMPDDKTMELHMR